MLLSKRIKVSLVGLVVAGGAAAALALGPAGTAVGQSSPPLQLQIAVRSPATLVANGAGVDVFVTARCSGPYAVSGSVAIFGLTERVGKYLAIGSGNAGTAFDCKPGRAQTVELLVIADAAVKAFDEGSAIPQVTVSACAVNGPCATQGLEPTIKISN